MRPHPFAASVAVATLATGLLGVAEREPLAATERPCTNPPAIEVSYRDMSVQDMARGMAQIAFLTDANEHTRENQLDYHRFLESKGIQVTEHVGAPQFEGSEGNTWLFELGDVPVSILRASGLRHVVVDYVKETDDYFEIHHTEDTLWATGNFEAEAGLAAMILDNYCDTEAVIANLEAITEAAGHRYDPDINQDYEAHGGSEAWREEFGSSFANIWSARSARIEFIDVFSDMIHGWGWGTYEDATSPVAQKMEYIRRIFNEIEPNGEALQQMGNYGGGIGTHGLSPELLVSRIICMTERLASARSEQEYDYFVREDFGDVPNDPDLPDCDRPNQLHLRIPFLEMLASFDR